MKYALQIFKVQRPLATNGSMNDCLVYNKDKTIQFFQSFSDARMTELFGNKFKIYVEAVCSDETGEASLTAIYGTVNDPLW